MFSLKFTQPPQNINLSIFSLNGAANLVDPANREFKNDNASISAIENTVMIFVTKAFFSDHLLKSGSLFSRIINAVTSMRLNAMGITSVSTLNFLSE